MPFGRVLFEPVRSADPPIISGHRRRQRFERVLRGDPGGDLLGGGGELLLEAANGGGERSLRQVAREPALELGALVGREAGDPLAPRRGAGRAALARPRARRARISAGTSKGGDVQPSRSRAPLISSAPSGEPWPLSVPALVGAPNPMVVRQAIRLGRSDDFAHAMAAAIASGSWPSTRDGVPAARLEALELVDRIRQRQRAVDRDAVVVEQHDQLGEPQVAGERDRLLADAFHEVAVGGQHEGVVIDHSRRRIPPRDAAPRSPCRPHCRGPGRAARWWSRRRAYGRIPGARRVIAPSWRKRLISSIVIAS